MVGKDLLIGILMPDHGFDFCVVHGCCAKDVAAMNIDEAFGAIDVSRTSRQCCFWSCIKCGYRFVYGSIMAVPRSMIRQVHVLTIGEVLETCFMRVMLT